MTNTAEKLTLPLFMVKYNGDLLISTGRSRFETSWNSIGVRPDFTTAQSHRASSRSMSAGIRAT